MNTTPKTPTSPKLIFGGGTSLIIGLFLYAASLITPDTFSFLGKWGGVLYLVITIAAGIVAGYFTEDPLRTAGAKANAASTGSVSDIVSTLQSALEKYAAANSPVINVTNTGDPVAIAKRVTDAIAASKPTETTIVAPGGGVSTEEMDKTLGWSKDPEPAAPAAAPAEDPDIAAAKKLLAS